MPTKNDIKNEMRLVIADDNLNPRDPDGEDDHEIIATTATNLGVAFEDVELSDALYEIREGD